MFVFVIRVTIRHDELVKEEHLVLIQTYILQTWMYSRVGPIKFIEESAEKDYIASRFLKVAFYKLYLVHS